MVRKSHPVSERLVAPTSDTAPPAPEIITKAGDWFAARLEGRRLPEHLLPEERS